MTRASVTRLALTPGEPGGIGPDLAIMLAQAPRPFEVVTIADAELLQQRAAQLGLPLSIDAYDGAVPAAPGRSGHLLVCPVPLAVAATPGQLDPRNSAAVLNSLDRACDGCLAGEFDAMVTGPVHKGVINDAGISFSGHTEYLAARTGGHPVMLLVAGELRVALVTTHLPLRSVADAVTADRLMAVARGLHTGLRQLFSIDHPRILVLGLNPHAGESGHLGREEIEVIEPALQTLRAEGLDLEGPLPADTAFTPPYLARADAVLAMYHDQGLAVLKHAGFGRAVNITLGLPIIRTSVDHGTATDLAGTGQASASSLAAALQLAAEISGRQRR